MRHKRTVPNEKELEGLYLWRKDPKSENGSFTNAGELDHEAVFGRLARTAHCRSNPGSTERKFSRWKDALLVIVPRKRLISLQEEHLWKSCTHDGVALISISALSWHV
jgi:hypothetical protein